MPRLFETPSNVAIRYTLVAHLHSTGNGPALNAIDAWCSTPASYAGTRNRQIDGFVIIQQVQPLHSLRRWSRADVIRSSKELAEHLA